MSNVFKDSQYGFAISRLEPNQGMVILGESYYPMGTASESKVVYTCDEEESSGPMQTLGVVKEFYAPNTLKVVGAQLMMLQPHLTKVSLQEGTKSIASEAFLECGELEEINLENVETIGATAFAACVSLHELHLNNVKTIEDSAFTDCTSATIYLNDNVESVGELAFYNVDHLYYHGNLEGAPWGAQVWN